MGRNTDFGGTAAFGCCVTVGAEAGSFGGTGVIGAIGGSGIRAFTTSICGDAVGNDSVDMFGFGAFGT